MRTWLLLTIFFLANVACVVVFAALYYAAGAECYTTDFSFMQMLWLSTTPSPPLGFGSISPDVCAGPQLLVLIEHFIAIIETALFTAIIITKLTQPQPKVRFSKNFIVNEDQDGSKWLVFRMVRESPHHLRDCKLNVCCGVVTREDGIVTGCSEEGLPFSAIINQPGNVVREASHRRRVAALQRAAARAGLHECRTHSLRYGAYAGG